MFTLKRAADFLLQNPLLTLIIVVLTANLSYLGSIALILIAFITLRKGAYEGGLLTLAALVIYFIYHLFINAGITNTNLGTLFFSVGAFGIFILWPLAIVLRQTANWGTVFDYLLVFGILVVAVLHFTFPDLQIWWQDHLVCYFTYTTKMMAKGQESPITPADMLKLSTDLSFFASGLVVTFFLVNTLIPLVLARWWQAIAFNPGGLRQELHNIRMSHVSAVIFIGIFGLAIWGNALAIDMAPVVCIFFGLAGLSLFHCLIKPLKLSWLWLILGYVVLILTFIKCIVLIAVFAMLDVWLNFRQKFAKKAS